MNTDEKIATALNGIVDLQAFLIGMNRAGKETFAQRLLKSQACKNFIEKRTDLLTLTYKSSITGTGAAGDPLVQSGKPFIDAGARQPLTIRSLLKAYPTANGAIELPVKNSATNAAGSQNREGTAFSESALGFTSSFTPVQTLGHHLPISNQVLEDSGTLDAFVRAELLSGLAEEIENQILNGTGANSELTGLLAAATPYSESSPVTYTTRLDKHRAAVYQVAMAKFRATAIVLHPTDWLAIELTRTTNNDYLDLYGDPVPRLWGRRVIETTAIAAGTFLVGDFNRAAILFEREAAVVQMARHDSTNFQKNMLTVRATERLALVITNSAAIVTGTL